VPSFYAAARALLVSHWPVNSGAAVKLTTAAFHAMRTEAAVGSMGRTGAPRNAILTLIDTGSPPSPPFSDRWLEGAATARAFDEMRFDCKLGRAQALQSNAWQLETVR
jgi:hypothetical protein